MDERIAESLVSLIREHGSLIIYLPDLLEEVVQMCEHKGSLQPLEEYRQGLTEIAKPDHFTERQEPFVAHRIEKLHFGDC